MPLLEPMLKQGIKKAIEDGMNAAAESGSPPLINSTVASALAGAYDDYAKLATAPPCVSVVLSGKTLLAQAFSAPNWAGVGPGLIVYWLSAAWAGGAYTGITIPAALSGASADLAAMDASADSVDAFATKFAGILHKYTAMLTVTFVGTPPLPPGPIV